jgi:hypothetical protein
MNLSERMEAVFEAGTMAELPCEKLPAWQEGDGNITG